MKTLIRIVLILLVNISLIACSNESAEIKQNDQLCPVLSENFSSEDLIGTWTANYSLNDTDTIIIYPDGTYKQIYNSPDANLVYEGELSDWTIEYRESGYARLHLKGMRRAGEVDLIFNRASGGVDPELFTAIDYCENEIVEMPDEVILIVTDASPNTLGGIVLRQTRLSGSDWTWSFELQE